MLKQALSDDQGQVSMMRVMSLIALFGALAVAAYDLATGGNASNAKDYFMLLLIGAFAPKLFQKYVESLFLKKDP